MTFSGKPKILVVDDEPSIRDNMERLLRSSGYEAVVAEDGQRALEQVSQQEFEVVLLDLRMPGISGTDVLHHLGSDSPDTCVIMLTVVASAETAVEAMKLGAYDYIIKPSNADDLLMRIERALERRRLVLQVKHYQKELEERLVQQAKEMREMMAQTVNALIHEELLARELEAKGGKRRGISPGADIKEFGARVLRRVSGG